MRNTFSGSSYSNVKICCFFLLFFFNILGFYCWLNETRHLKTSPWTLRICMGIFLLMTKLMNWKKTQQINEQWNESIVAPLILIQHLVSWHWENADLNEVVESSSTRGRPCVFLFVFFFVLSCLSTVGTTVTTGFNFLSSPSYPVKWWFSFLFRLRQSVTTTCV